MLECSKFTGNVKWAIRDEYASCPQTHFNNVQLSGRHPVGSKQKCPLTKMASPAPPDVSKVGTSFSFLAKLPHL